MHRFHQLQCGTLSEYVLKIDWLCFVGRVVPVGGLGPGPPMDSSGRLEGSRLASHALEYIYRWRRCRMWSLLFRTGPRRFRTGQSGPLDRSVPATPAAAEDPASDDSRNESDHGGCIRELHRNGWSHG